MELTHTHFRYLLAIYELSQTGGAVSSARVAAALGVSKPSVARMLGVLTERALVEKERYGKISLTDAGLAAAQTYQGRVRRLAERMPALGLDLSGDELREAAGVLAASLPERCFTGNS